MEEEKIRIGRIHINLNNMDEDSLKQIKKIHMNIQSYSKLKELGQKIKPYIDNLQNLKEKFQ